MNHYNLGDTILIKAQFKSYDDGSFTDPQTVSVKVKNSNAETVYVYGVDAEVVKEDVGIYTMLIATDVEGKWCFTWKGEGQNSASNSGQFFIDELPC